MSLKHGILGFLIYGVSTGYELNKAFQDSVDNFWHATSSQIYRELDWLEAHGMAASEILVQNGKPNKKQFEITDQGREMFLEWMAAEDKDAMALRSSFLMRVFFSGLRSAEETRMMLAAFEDDCRKREAMTEIWEQHAGHYQNKMESGGHSMYWEFTIDFGRRYLKMCQEWAQAASNKLKEPKAQGDEVL